MNAEQMIGSILRGALGVRRKRHQNTLDFLLGGRRGWLNASTLMTAAGVAWGLYETLSNSETVAAPPTGPSGGGTPPPGAPAVPPIPPIPPTPVAASTSTGAVPPAVLRVIRLTISAARADGTLSPSEEAAILQHAKAAGAEAVVAAELSQPTPLAAVVGDAEPEQRKDLYTLAYAIVRADQEVSGGERIYLAQLAHQLGLTPEDVAALEQHAADRIAGAGA